MLGMRVVALEIYGPRGVRRERLDHQLVAVSGPTNSGKTSMADCIAYCLGQKVAWKKAFDYVTECVLQIRIGKEEYRLRRPLGRGSGHIEVFNLGNELVERLSVRVAGNDPAPTFSDWMLTRLSIKDDIDADDVRALNPKAARLTFTDVRAYLYRMQSELDRQVILHPGGRDKARKELFELMFHLNDPKARILQARLGEARRSATEQERVLANVEEFFSDTGTRPERATVDHTTATEDLQRTTEALRQARAEIRQWEATRRGLRSEHTQAQQRWRRASARLEQSHTTLRSLGGEGTSDFCGNCPACGQEVAVDRTGDDHCGLCLQPVEPSVVSASSTEAARRAVHEAEQELARASEALTAAIDALDRHDETDPVDTRHLIEELSAHQAATRERIERLEAGIAQTKRLQDLKAGAEAAREEVATLKREITVVQDQAPHRGTVLDEIEQRVREEIAAIDPPWFNGEVRLDREHFTPLVDGQTFEQLGGGVKAAINTAFSFGLARYALSAEDHKALLPRFLIVDAIRKNIGSNKEDQAFATRLYQRASLLAYNLGTLGGQVIVLDNDGWPPTRELRDYPYKPVKLDYDEPLILGVSHADTGENPYAPDENE